MGRRQSSSEAASIVDGRAIAAAVRRQVADTVASLAHQGQGRPGLATILIGDDPASQVYVASKHRACAEAGIESFHHHLPADVAGGELLELIDLLNDDDAVSGILCQPVPDLLDAEEVTNRIPAHEVRRRSHNRKRRPPRAGNAWAPAVHPGRSDAAARTHGRRAARKG